MNKRLLLITLPVLMALSSCTYLASGTVQQKGDFFKEDAVAHSELFGGEEEGFELKAKQPFYSMTPGEGSLLEPKIGVQYRDTYNNGAQDCIAVRFVAAIANGNVNAEWTRAAYKANGDMTGTEETVEVTKAYTSVVGGESLPEGYGCYVVFTVYDIPVTTFNDYYIVAYLKLSDPENPATVQYSKATAARIGGGVQASFAYNTTGYFLAGTINGAENSYLPSVSLLPGDATNEARFSGSLRENDVFNIYHKTASTFKAYDSSYIKTAPVTLNPYLQDEGVSGNRIKVSATHNYAFNFDDSDGIKDLDCGYTVTYTNNSDSSVTVPLVYNGVDGSKKNQYLVRISPKPGSSLDFKLDGSSISPTGESGANVNGSLEIIYGGPEIDLYLKDQVGSYTLWATYPEETYSLLLNGVDQVATDVNPGDWGLKAMFEVYLTTGTTASIKWGYSIFTAASAVTKDSYYWVRLHDDYTVTYYDRVSNYYMVGKINGSEDWDHVSSHRFLDTTTSGEFKLLDPISLKNGDSFKVVLAEDPSNKPSWTWYPGGSNCTIASDGNYDVYFRPGYTGGAGWHESCIYVAAAS